MLVSELVSILQSLPQDAYIEVLHTWYNGNDDIYDLREIQVMAGDNLETFVIVPNIQPTINVVKSAYNLINIKEL